MRLTDTQERDKHATIQFHKLPLVFSTAFLTYRVIQPQDDILRRTSLNTHNSDAPPKMAAKSRRHSFESIRTSDQTYIPP